MNSHEVRAGQAFRLGQISSWQWAGAGLVAGLIAMAYFPTLEWMVQRWGAAESYYSHGYLVPFVTLWLIWQKRDFLWRENRDEVLSGRAAWGLALTAAALFLHLASGYFRIFFTSGFSLVLLLSGIALYLFGPRLLRSIWFALAFLLFMVPLPLLAIAGLNLRLKLLVTEWALTLLNAVGILAVQDGSTILFEHDTLTVGNACSGLRSIISLLALGALYAYLFRSKSASPGSRWRHGLKQVLLFLSSVPVAMVANILRIFLLGVVAHFYGSRVATGTVHDVSGYLLFAVAFALLYLVGKALDRAIPA